MPLSSAEKNLVGLFPYPPYPKGKTFKKCASSKLFVGRWVKAESVSFVSTALCEVHRAFWGPNSFLLKVFRPKFDHLFYIVMSIYFILEVFNQNYISTTEKYLETHQFGTLTGVFSSTKRPPKQTATGAALG